MGFWGPGIEVCSDTLVECFQRKGVTVIAKGLAPGLIDGPLGVDNQAVKVEEEGAKGGLHVMGSDRGRRQARGSWLFLHEDKDQSEGKKHHSEKSEKTSENYAQASLGESTADIPLGQ